MSMKKDTEDLVRDFKALPVPVRFIAVGVFVAVGIFFIVAMVNSESPTPAPAPAPAAVETTPEPTTTTQPAPTTTTPPPVTTEFPPVPGVISSAPPATTDYYTEGDYDIDVPNPNVPNRLCPTRWC